VVLPGPHKLKISNLRSESRPQQRKQIEAKGLDFNGSFGKGGRSDSRNTLQEENGVAVGSNHEAVPSQDAAVVNPQLQEHGINIYV
jgi:hypothetical protein